MAFEWTLEADNDSIGQPIDETNTNLDLFAGLGDWSGSCLEDSSSAGPAHTVPTQTLQQRPLRSLPASSYPQHIDPLLLQSQAQLFTFRASQPQTLPLMHGNVFSPEFSQRQPYAGIWQYGQTPMHNYVSSKYQQSSNTMPRGRAAGHGFTGSTGFAGSGRHAGCETPLQSSPDIRPAYDAPFQQAVQAYYIDEQSQQQFDVRHHPASSVEQQLLKVVSNYEPIDQIPPPTQRGPGTTGRQKRVIVEDGLETVFDDSSDDGHDARRDIETGKRICANRTCSKLLAATRNGKRCARCQVQYSNQKRGCTIVSFLEDMDYAAAHRLLFSMQNDYDMSEQTPDAERDLADNTTPEARTAWIKAIINAINEVYVIPEGKYKDETDEITAQGFVTNQQCYNLKFGHKDPQYTARHINARAHLLFEAARRFQSGEMITVYDDGGDNHGYSIDASSHFSERMRRICEALRDNKRIVMDVIEGRGINAFVRNPHAFQHRKIDNLKSNEKKRKNRLNAQGVEALVENQPTGSRKTQMIKTQLALSEQKRAKGTEAELRSPGAEANFIKVGPPRGRQKPIRKRKRRLQTSGESDNHDYEDEDVDVDMGGQGQSSAHFGQHSSGYGCLELGSHQHDHSRELDQAEKHMSTFEQVASSRSTPSRSQDSTHFVSGTGWPLHHLQASQQAASLPRWSRTASQRRDRASNRSQQYIQMAGLAPVAQMLEPHDTSHIASPSDNAVLHLDMSEPAFDLPVSHAPAEQALHQYAADELMLSDWSVQDFEAPFSGLHGDRE